MAQTPFGLNNPAAKLTTGAVQALMPAEPSRIIDPTLAAAFAEADAPKDPQPFQTIQTELDEQKKAAWIKSARDLADADLNAIDDIQAQALFINAVKNDPRFGYEDPDGTLTFGAESSFGRENARRMKRAMIDGDENALYSQKYRDFLALSEDEQLKQAEGENKPMTLSKPVPGYGGDPQSFAEPKPEKSADEKKTILDTYRNKLLSEQRTAAFTALTAPLSETARDWVTYSINSQTADPSTFALIPEHEQKFAAAAVALQRRTANIGYGSIVGIEFGRAVSALATGGTEFMSDQLARARNLRNAEARGLDLSEVADPAGNPAEWKARQIVQDVRHDGKELDRRTQIRTQLEEAREQLLPESGFAGNIPRGVISSLPYMAAVSNPFTGTLAVLGMANDSRERMIAEGVDGETASVVGLASGAIQSWIEKAQLNTIIGGKLTELELRKLTMGQFGKVLAAKDWSLLGTEIQRRGSVAVRSWASELAEETAQGLTDELAVQTGTLITTGTADIRPIVANTLQTFIDSAPATLGFGLLTGSGIGPSIGSRMRGGAITGAEMADLAGKYRSAASALQGLLEESPQTPAAQSTGLDPTAPDRGPVPPGASSEEIRQKQKSDRTIQLLQNLRTEWSKARTDADKRQTLITAGLPTETADLVHETFNTEYLLSDASAEDKNVLWTQGINADITPETLLQIPNIVRAESISPTETRAFIQLAKGKEAELIFRYGATGRAADPARFDSQLRNAIGPDIWDNADESQRDLFRQDAETNTKAFYVTAPGSTSSLDSKGIITLTDTENPATLDDLYHETFHAATELAIKSGVITAEQIATLRTVYGEAANAGEMFDTEKAAIAYAQHLAGRKTKTSGIFQSILDFLSSIRNTVFGRRESIPANATASEIFDLIAEGRLDQLPAEAIKTQEETPAPTGKESLQVPPEPAASSESIQQPVPSTDGSSITQPELIPKPKRTPQWKAVTPQGNITVAGDWEIRDLDSLVSSDLDAYDQTLQPRDRTSIGSKEQIHTIAADFQPDRLFDSAETDGGSPIVVGNQILSGNGRTLVLRRLVQLQRFGEYQKAMKAKAAELGLEIPAGMKHPVLVRVGKLRTGKNATWAKVAELSNRNKILTRTPAEQAEADAKTIRDNNLLDLFVPSQEGNILAATNRNFINAFVQRTGDAGLLDSKGNPTDGLETRIERALLAVLTDADRDTIKSLLETSLPIRQAVSGLISAAPDILSLATDKPAYDLRPEIAAALKKYLDFKRSEVKNIDEYLAQTDLLATPSPEVDALTRQLATATPAQLGDFFRSFSRLARAVNTETEDIFGAAPATKADLLSRAGEDTRFSLKVSDESKTLEAAFTNPDGSRKPGWMKAPNGKDTKLTERQWLQVRTPAFKAWFGDWENDPANASKVVDENGEPLVVYHGAKTDFHKFEDGKFGIRPDTSRGFYFSPYKQVGKNYSGHTDIVKSVYLNIKNPKIASNYNEIGLINKEYVELAEKIGFDGAYYSPTGEEINNPNTGLSAWNEEYVAFSPSQIKSATDNTGAFSTENPDIRFSLKTTVEEKRNLVAVHNITETKLKKALQIGGFPMPSIAVTRTDIGHPDFGNISLVFGRDSIDPKRDGNEVYDSDVWSPTVPEIEIKLNDKIATDLYRRAMKTEREFKDNPIVSKNFRSVMMEESNLLSRMQSVSYESDQLWNGIGKRNDALVFYAAINGKLDKLVLDQTGYVDETKTLDAFGSEYLDWFNSNFDNLIEKYGIRNGKDLYTPTGNSRSFEATHDPVTLENLMKTMKKDDKTANIRSLQAYTIRAAIAYKFRSIEDIREMAASMKKIPQKELEAKKDKIDGEIIDVTSEIEEQTGLSGFDSFRLTNDAAIDAIKKFGRSLTSEKFAEFLKREYKIDVKKETADKFVSIVNEIKRLPTTMFEAKPRRAVRFDEIKAVILPTETDPDLVSKLKSNGVGSIIPYDGTEQDRLDKLNALPNDIRFSLRITPEQDKSYLDAVERGDTATAQQMVDDAAKASGYNIGPVYHGTNAEFNEFKYTEDIGFHLGTKQQATRLAMKKGGVAGNLDGFNVGVTQEELDSTLPRLVRAHIRLENPVKANDTIWYHYRAAAKALVNAGAVSQQETDSILQAVKRSGRGEAYMLDRLQKLLIKKGFDGVEYANDFEGRGISYIVFAPSQIKSADPITRDDSGNVIPLSERFNTRKKDIRYSISATEKKNWSDALDAYQAGTLNRTQMIRVLNGTPRIVQDILEKFHGITENKPIEISAGTLDKITQDKHAVSIDQLRKLQDNLDDPIAVFKSATRTDSIVVYTDLIDSQTGKKSVVSIVYNASKDSQIQINAISTIHGRPVNQINQWISDGLLEYANEQKNNRVTFPHRLQLPRGVKRGYLYLTEKDFPAGEESIPNSTDNVNEKQTESERYSIKLGADSVETLITAALATRITRGEKIGIQDAERLTRNLNIGSTPSQILDQAKQLADANSGRLEQFAQKTDAQLYQTLVNLKMRDNYIRALRTADQQGFAEGRKLQGDLNKIRSIKDLTMKQEIEAVEGIPTSEIELSFGIDIAQSVVNSVYPAAEEKDKNRIARPGADIPPELAGTPAAASVDAIPEPLQKLIDSATRKAEAEQHTRDKQKLAAESSTAETPDPETVQPAPAPSTDGSKSTARAKTPFQNPIQFRAFIEELVLHHLKQNPNYSAKDPFAKPANIRLYALTAQNILTDLARKLTYSFARENITKDLEELPSLPIKTTLDRQIEHLYARITRNTIKETQEQLTATLERDIRRTALTGPQFGGSKPELDRKIQTLKERFARNVLAYLRLTPLQIEEETNRLQNILTTQAQEIEGVADYSANEDRDYQNALDQLNALTNFGGIRYLSPGEIQDKSAQIIRYIGESAEQLAAEREERALRNGRAIYDLSLAIKNPADLPTPKPNKILDYVNSAIALYDLKLLDLIRFAKGTTYSAAKNVIDDISTLNSLAAQQKSIYIQTQTELMRKTLAGIYGSEKAAIERISQTCPNWKEFSNQNRALTIGEALQLYGSIVQKDYQFNARAHKRDGQRLDALKSNFTAKEYALLQAVRMWYRSNRQYLDQSYTPIIGMPILSPGIDYLPIKTYQDPQGLPGRAKAWTLIPPGLISRVRHARDFDESIDIIEMWHDRLEQSAQFAAYAQNGLDISAILGNNTVQDTIVRSHGKEVLKSILNQTVDILSGRTSTPATEGSLWLANIARAWIARTALAYNPSSMLKQIGGIPAIAIHPDVNLTHLVSGLISPDKTIMKQLLASDGYKARYGEGASEEIANAIRDGQGKGILTRIFDKGFEVPQFGDRIAALWTGQAIYPDMYNTLRQQGYSPQDAVKRAEARTWSIIEQTQQSRRIENQSVVQREGGALGKMLYQFVSSPAQQLAFEQAAIKRAIASPTTNNKAYLLRVLIINHAITPALMALASSAIRAITGTKDDGEENENQTRDTVFEALAYIVTGPLSGLFLAGAIGESLITGLTTGKRTWGQTGLPVTKIADTAATAGVTVYHLITLDGEKLGKDFRRVLKEVSAPTRLGVTFYENRIMDDDE